MEATFLAFPGKGPRKVPVPGANGTTTLNAFLDAAGEKYAPNDTVEYAVDGQVVTDGNAPVKEGSVVSKTARVAGG